MLQTVGNAGAVLKLFTGERPAWRLAEVVDAVGLPPSSTHAVLSSLVDIGLLRVVHRGRYEIGWRVLAVNAARIRQSQVAQVVHPILRRLSEQISENVHYGILDRWTARCIHRIEHAAEINVLGPRPGDILAAHSSATSKVLLAYRNFDEVRSLAMGQPRNAANATVSVLAELRAELDRVRESGIAFDHQDTVPGVHCVSVPVYEEKQVVVGAITATAPECRYARHHAHVEDALRTASNRIEQALAEASRKVAVGHPARTVDLSTGP
jgi:DNA-binding IclR family transcriptional regulator